MGETDVNNESIMGASGGISLPQEKSEGQGGDQELKLDDLKKLLETALETKTDADVTGRQAEVEEFDRIKKRYENPGADAEKVIAEIKEAVDKFLDTKTLGLAGPYDHDQLTKIAHQIVSERFRQKGLGHLIELAGFYEQKEEEYKRLLDKLIRDRKKSYGEYLTILFGLRYLARYINEKIKGFTQSEGMRNFSKEDLSNLDEVVRRHGASVLEQVAKHYLRIETYNPLGLVLLLFSGRLGESQNVAQIKELLNNLPNGRKHRFASLLKKVVSMHENGGEFLQPYDEFETSILGARGAKLSISKNEGVVRGNASEDLDLGFNIFFEDAKRYFSSGQPPEKLLEDLIIRFQ